MLTTIVFPNYGWVETMEMDIKKAGAKIIKPTSHTTVKYGRQISQEWACVIDVDINKLDEYLKAHMLDGNKIASL